MAHAATSHVGSRVQWIGPPQSGYVSPAYWTSDGAGNRLPAADEVRDLHPGDKGTVTDLVSVPGADQQYVIEFDGGYALEVVLPAPTLLRFLDEAGRSEAG